MKNSQMRQEIVERFLMGELDDEQYEAELANLKDDEDE